jgi:DNA polymerase III sliding clamp (beta) subunit (PCNA family)
LLEIIDDSLQGVALTASQDSRAVRLDLSPQYVRLSANASGLARSQAEVPADFQGGGDSVIHTAFNPAYLQDALKTLQGDTVIIDVDQNGIGCDGRVFGKPALLYAQQDPIAKWVIMPVSADLEPNRENLGSNYPEDMEDRN